MNEIDFVCGKNWQWSVDSMQKTIEESGDEWHQLAIKTGIPPTALPIWYASMYDAFGDMDGLVSVHRLYYGTHLVAVLPMSFKNGIFRSWQPYQHRWYTPLWAFALEEGIIGIGREIRRHFLSNAEILDLKYMLADSTCVTQLLDGVNPERVLVQNDPEESDVYFPICESWEQCRKELSAKLVKKIKEKKRQLESKGTLALSVIDGNDSLDETMTECLELEASGWKGKAGTAIRCLPQSENFYRKLAKLAAKSGILLIYMLRLDGRLIAFDFCLRTLRRLDSLKIAYDETFARESPGNILRYMIIENECREGLSTSIHWGQPSAHKALWTHYSNRLVRIRLFADTYRGRFSHAAYSNVWPVLRGMYRSFRK